MNDRIRDFFAEHSEMLLSGLNTISNSGRKRRGSDTRRPALLMYGMSLKADTPEVRSIAVSSPPINEENASLPWVKTNNLNDVSGIPLNQL